MNFPDHQRIQLSDYSLNYGFEILRRLQDGTSPKMAGFFFFSTYKHGKKCKTGRPHKPIATRFGVEEEEQKATLGKVSSGSTCWTAALALHGASTAVDEGRGEERIGMRGGGGEVKNQRLFLNNPEKAALLPLKHAFMFYKYCKWSYCNL